MYCFDDIRGSSGGVVPRLARLARSALRVRSHDIVKSDEALLRDGSDLHSGIVQ